MTFNTVVMTGVYCYCEKLADYYLPFGTDNMAMLLPLFVSSRKKCFTCVAHVVCTVESSGVQLFMQQLEGRACTKLTHAM